MHRLVGQGDLRLGDVVVVEGGQQMRDHVEPGGLLGVRFHDIPRRRRCVRDGHHLVAGPRVVLPPVDRLEVHRRELPLPHRVFEPLLKAAQLLGVGHRKPILAQDDAVVDQHVLEDRRLLQKQRMLLWRTESHHLLNTRPVVPRPVEKDDLAPGGQLGDVALEIPLPPFPVRWGRQSRHPDNPRAGVFGDPFDGAALACSVTALEEDSDSRTGVTHPFLCLHQFRLQTEQFRLIDVGGDLALLAPLLAHPRMVSPRSYCAASSSSSSDSRSSAGNISTSLMASRSALMPKYNIPEYDVTPIASTWLCSSGGTAY